MQQIETAIYNTVFNGKLSTDELALALGKSAQVLRNQANPNNETHKMGLLESVAVQKAQGTSAIHDAVGRSLGVANLPLTDKQPKSVMDALLDVVKEHGDVGGAIRDAFKDGNFTAAEKHNCLQQATEEIQALIVLQEALNATPIGSIKVVG